MWRLWGLGPRDYLGIALGVAVFSMFGIAAVLYPQWSRDNAELRFGPGWQCSNAQHGICVKTTREKSWPQSEFSASN
jgi:hypothetical protein